MRGGAGSGGLRRGRKVGRNRRDGEANSRISTIPVLRDIMRTSKGRRGEAEQGSGLVDEEKEDVADELSGLYFGFLLGILQMGGT